MFRKRAKAESYPIFFRAMAVILSSGLPVVKGINVMRETFRQSDPIMHKALSRMVNVISAGGNIKVAFKGESLVFSPRHYYVIGAGELGGNLDEAFLGLAESEEAIFRTRKKIYAALTYPVFILAFYVLLATLILPHIVLPAITQTGISPEHLPALTRAVCWVCLLLQDPKAWAIALAFLASLRACYRTSHRLAFLRWLQRLPLIQKALEAAAVSGFFRSFYELNLAGVSIQASVVAAAQCSGSEDYYNHFSKLNLEAYNQLDTLFSIFPPVVRNMVAVADQSGQLDKINLCIALFYEQQLESYLNLGLALLEPLLMSAMGITAAVVVFAIMLPILQLMASFA